MVRGKDAVYLNLIPDGMQESLDMLSKLVEELAIDSSDLILSGFSQGSMILTHLALRKFDSPVAGLALLSSTLIAEQLIEQTPFNLNILQTHGRGGPVLPFNGAKMLEGKLASLGHVVDFVEFDGGHEIPMKALESLQSIYQ